MKNCSEDCIRSILFYPNRDNYYKYCCRVSCINFVACFGQDNLRLVSCSPVSEGHYVLHPDPITRYNVDEAIQNGVLFARKFDTEIRGGIIILVAIGYFTEPRVVRRFRIGGRTARFYYAARIAPSRMGCFASMKFDVFDVNVDICNVTAFWPTERARGEGKRKTYRSLRSSSKAYLRALEAMHSGGGRSQASERPLLWSRINQVSRVPWSP